MKRLFLCMERELVVVKEQYDNYETTYHLQKYATYLYRC